MSTREKNVVSRFGYNDYMAYHYAFMMKVATILDPENFFEAAKDPWWVEAINEDMQSLSKNETWDLIPPSHHEKAIGCWWIFKVKHNSDNTVNRYKARLVAKGYAQTCCTSGWTSLNTGVYPTLLQRGGKDWMLGYTRKMITISTDGKTIQRQE